MIKIYAVLRLITADSADDMTFRTVAAGMIEHIEGIAS